MSTVNLNDSKAPVVKVPPNYKEVLTLRCKDYSYGKSRGGNDQITLVTEIIKPEDVELDGVKYVLAGQEITFYLGLSDEVRGKAKSSPMAAFKEFHTKLGLPMEIDTDNLPYEGLCFEFYGQTQEQVVQRPGPGGKFEPVLGEDGKPRTLGWQWSNYLSNVIGPSSLSTNEAF